MFRLDEKNHSAIYIQIMDNIKEMIMTDVWGENEKIPSVRELSEQLTLNPNTVQKAYRELEREGYIYTISGKGSFVGGKKDIKQDPAKVNELMDNVREAFRGLTHMGYSPEDAAALIQGTVMESVDAAVNNERR